jgi:hypothetical protein
MSLSVLKQLGIKLYSSIPPVLSEAVANAWDADATKVDITISKEEIVINDNGDGMTVDDANDRYLLVGYERRKEKERSITKLNRPVMGRKGIGKLSLFSIAQIVEVHTAKDGDKHGFRMDVKKIQECIEASNGNGDYKPEPIYGNELRIKENKGMIIVLKSLTKKRINVAVDFLRRRIARRFSILEGNNFTVKINDVPVTIEDRGYFDKIQNLWYFGEDGERYVEYCDADKLEHHEPYPGKITVEWPDQPDRERETFGITGWIGSVVKSGNLNDNDDNLNKIVIMVRGKLAQEDILEDFSEGGLFTRYLVGEIHGDFFDLDELDDAATSNRQELIKDDPRYKALKNWLDGLVKYIKSGWTELRIKEGKKAALAHMAISEWFDRLKPKTKKKAESLFGKINQLPLEPGEKKQLFKHGVLAFESLRYKENLEALEKITPENLKEFTEVLAEHDDIEATLYHQIIKERLEVINVLYEKIEDNAYEKTLQEYLYEHLWLLEPSWDRATETAYMEKKVKSLFDGIDTNLTPEERNARFDIKYKKPSGQHVIIEMKRASVLTDSLELQMQVKKYYDALKKFLREVNETTDIEIICIVGRELRDWADDEERRRTTKSLAEKKIRVILYQELINDSMKAYRNFLDEQKKAGRVTELIQRIDKEDF